VYDFTPLPARPTDRTRPVHVMTVDVEDYFHVSAFAGTVSPDQWPALDTRVVGSTSRLIDLFAEHGVRATFFVLGWVADRHPELVRRIADNGHELASHSYWHRLVYDLTPEEFRDDLRRARDVIESAAGVRIRGFRAPSYSIVERSLWALDVLVEEGYAYDASIFPVRHDVYGIPDAPRAPHFIDREAGRLLELPGVAARIGPLPVPVGGGYFRLLPYAVTRWAIARYTATAQQPAIFYLHPWEIDPDQPRLQAPLKSRLRHYNQLAQTETRLRRLLRDFAWDSIAATLLPTAAPARPSAVSPQAVAAEA
jgi:polysaccharide deacetylase family protein (PEP-CTERM system associated)